MNDDWRSSAIKRAQAKAIAGIGAPLVGALARTWRWRVEGMGQYEAVTASGRQPIMAFWHGRILPATIHFRDRGIVVITSANFDGEWIAGIIARFGYGTARGSTSRGARRATVQLLREMRGGKATAFTVDGPRGPAGIAQPGAVWLAGATGNPVLPFHAEAEPAWTVRSWDRTQIPKPFATVALVVGEPLEVPREAGDAVLEEARRELETRLQRLQVRARALLAGTGGT